MYFLFLFFGYFIQFLIIFNETRVAFSLSQIFSYVTENFIRVHGEKEHNDVIVFNSIR